MNANGAAPRAGDWSELLLPSQRLTGLYAELPPLERLVLRSVHLSPYGPGVKLRVELSRFPDRAPAAWTEAGCDRFEVQLAFLAVGEDLRMRGIPGGSVVGLELSPLVPVRERRIRVAVRGADFTLDFTAYAGLQASHLNAYRSGDGDPYAARRWFVSRVDQHLYRALPGTTGKPFYDHP